MKTQFNAIDFEKRYTEKFLQNTFQEEKSAPALKKGNAQKDLFGDPENNIPQSIQPVVPTTSQNEDTYYQHDYVQQFIEEDRHRQQDDVTQPQDITSENQESKQETLNNNKSAKNYDELDKKIQLSLERELARREGISLQQMKQQQQKYDLQKVSPEKDKGLFGNLFNKKEQTQEQAIQKKNANERNIIYGDKDGKHPSVNNYQKNSLQTTLISQNAGEVEKKYTAKFEQDIKKNDENLKKQEKEEQKRQKQIQKQQQGETIQEGGVTGFFHKIFPCCF